MSILGRISVNTANERTLSGLDRRGVLKLAGLAGLGTTLAACGKGFGGGGDDSGGKIELNMVWWGAAERAQATQKTLDLFMAANPTIKIRTEFQDSSPYKDKLVTRFAGGTPPDLSAMRVDSIVEYAGRGSLLDLTPYGADKLDLSGLSDAAKALGTVGDKVYGVPSGLNAVGFVVDKTLTDKYGVPIPDGDKWSWAELGDFAKEITAKSKKAVYGAFFDHFTIANFLVFIRQRGESLYTDGKFVLPQEATTAWFQLANDFRASGAFPPPGFIDPTNGSSPDQSYLAKKKLAAQIIPTNNLGGYNKACGGNLQLLAMPGETQGKQRGNAVGTPQIWSIAAQSKHPEETLKLLNFITNNADAAKATGTTRGVPPSRKVAEAIAPSLTPDDKRASDYLAGLQSQKLQPTYPDPVGGGKLADLLKSLQTEVEFKRKTPAQAAKDFDASARKALGA
jgi:multiple sugar transport system substrate-binding protein